MNRTKVKFLHIQKLRYLFLPAVLTGILLFVASGQIPFTTNAQTTGTFTFGVVGDVGGNSGAGAVLNTVKSANLNFFLHVGDFSYDTQGGPSGWPTWVKGIVGTTLPYEILSGNHDDCCIDTYVQGLPNKMANINGTYGKNYYFDYPQTSPLARFILIDPVAFATDINWLTTAIDSARSSRIPWVIVGMHQNYISTGAKSNEIPSSIYNLMYSKKVDLVLQGHDHNYQRSKQLTCVTINTTNQSCIANAGPNYSKGAGTVLLIDGSGGNSLYGVLSSDSEAGYFAKINSDTYGFSKLTITANQISEQFVRAAGGTLSDSFTITGNTTTNPSITSGPVPSVGNPAPTGIVPTYVCGGSGVGSSCPPTNGPISPGGGGGSSSPSNQPINSGISSVPVTQPLSNPSNNPNGIQPGNNPNGNTNPGIRNIGDLVRFILNLIMLILGFLIRLFTGGR